MITANTWFNLPWRAWLKGRILPQARRHQVSIPEGIADVEPAVAHIARGAWLVRCPDCRGAEYAWEEGEFFCMSCLNGKVGHKIRPSAFPPERKEIEALLMVRPLMNRNWYHDESLADLEKENEEHKDELLVKEPGEGG